MYAPVSPEELESVPTCPRCGEFYHTLSNMVDGTAIIVNENVDL